MDSIKIETGTKTIEIERDGVVAGSISFNPFDLVFVERFERLYSELHAKQAEYLERAKVLESDGAVDDNGMPLNASSRMEYLLEICTYMRGKIDGIFGADTSQIVFGETMKFEVIKQFLDGVTPYIQQVRNDKIAKYTTLESAKRNRVTRKRTEK
jgi:hypothetical protein